MPRRARAPIRPVEPDSRYRSRLVQQIVNAVMRGGKKSLAERITYDALAIVGERTSRPPVEVLEARGHDAVAMSRSSGVEEAGSPCT